MIYENWVTPTTDDEWNAEIKLDSLHIKWHNEPERPDKYPSSQLDAMLASHKVKRDRVEADRVHVMERVILLIEKEIEFREQGTFERSPIGTEYFVDPGSGNDTTGDGLSSSTSWKTYEKFSEAARSAGDRCTIRRDATPMWLSVHGDHTSDGELGNPITIEADYDDTWGDFANSTQTFTAVAGAKTMEASTTITGISVGDWCFVIGDDAREYCFEVKAVSGTTLTLWLPYIGETFGTGKTLTIMGPSPIQGDTSNIIGGYWSADFYWEIRGISYLGGHTYGGIGVTNGRVNFRHVISDGRGVTGMQTGSQCWLHMDGFRIIGGTTRCLNNTATGSSRIQIRNGDIDGVLLAADRGVYSLTAIACVEMTNVHIHDCVAGIDQVISGTINGDIIGRNITFADNTTDVMASDIDGVDCTVVSIEDFNGVVGDNRVFSGKGTTTSDAWLKTAQPTPPTDGADDSLWVVPGTYFGGWHFGGHNLIGDNTSGTPGSGVPVYMAAGAKTFTLNFRSLAIADWTVNPTAAELFIEMEYLAHATNATRSRKRSTDTVDFAGVITWDTITLAVTAGQAGYAYLRVFYSKPKEASVSNEFYMNRRVSWA